jgi:hypothetical protein
MNELIDACCVLHVHSTFSDGTGSVPEIAEAARENGVDVVLLTDHDTLRARRTGHERWFDSVLVLIGEEVSPRRGNHYLAFGLEKRVRHKGLDAHEIIRAVESRGGFGFAAHPFSVGNARLSARLAVPMAFRALDDPALRGLELWSHATDVVEGVHSWRGLFRVFRNPQRFSPNPPVENLARYDQLCASRRVVAVGGLDAHQFGVRVFGRVPVKVLSYEQTFGLLRTHVLLRSALSGDLDADRASVFEALRAGRAYIAFDGAAPARGFSFWAIGPDGQRLEMGEEASGGGGPWRLEVRTPQRAALRLVGDGVGVAEADATTLSFDADSGVFRVEARLGERVWILSNPIYLR